MSWRTSTAGVFARNVGRRLGVNRLIGRLRAHGYEPEYEARLSDCIGVDDVVWDVGANVGYYTRQFVDRVGASGKVVAFEPSAVNFAELARHCGDLNEVMLQPFGLGANNARMHFEQGADALGATSRVVDGRDGGVMVEVRAGDELIAAGTLPAPNVIKIDVEGFEGEVLAGLADCLKSSTLRALGIEVHFSLLQQRGLGRTPRLIEEQLRAAGFHVSWPDSSHILATR